MSEELQLFLEDMDEQLSIMESTLLDMSEISIEEIDTPMIDKLFRAMHTMKGNAGIFNYDVIVNFAHDAENLLDEVRNGKIGLTKELIELFLQINDHSKLLIEIYTNNNELNDEQKQYHEYLLKQLESFLGNDIENTATDNNLIEFIEEESLGESKTYEINLKLKEDFYKSGMDIMSIIKYLAALGEVNEVKLINDSIPSFDEIDPLCAYISFKIIYTTEEPQEEIIDAFEFVQEDIELKVEEIENKQPEKTEAQETFEEKQEEEPTYEEESPAGIFENKKEENKPGSVLSNSFNLKVDSLKVDKLINQISEMVIANAKITQYANNSKDPNLEEAVTVMSEMLEEIRNSVMDIRMVQVGSSFSKLRRIVTDNAKKMAKEINFKIEGGETELDKSVIEKISDPLVHMLRNSVDHGIESPDKRLQKGKDTKGNITLKAYPDAGTIVIQIIDDGAGINKNYLLKKAIEKKLIEPDVQLNDNEIYNLIFTPGFSTAKEVTDISGRGVGMDVVKRNIEDLRGTVEVESELDKGTVVTVRLPLTLAIIDGFLVKCGQSKYIIPIDNIQECIELTSQKKEELEKKRIYKPEIKYTAGT